MLHLLQSPGDSTPPRLNSPGPSSSGGGSSTGGPGAVLYIGLTANAAQTQHRLLVALDSVEWCRLQAAALNANEEQTVRWREREGVGVGCGRRHEWRHG